MKMPANITLKSKKACMVRCFCAVAMSVAIQFLLLCIFLLFVNFRFLEPINWILNTMSLMLSPYTWLSIIPLIFAVVVYSILLGKCYLKPAKYYPSRFKWFMGNVLWKLGFLSEHIIIAFLTTWLYTRFIDSSFGSFTTDCFGSKCINCNYTFLLYASIVTSCTYFIKENWRQQPQVEFSVIQEMKWIQIRSAFYATIYNCLVKTFMPTIYFTFAYWLFGGVLNKQLSGILHTDTDDTIVTVFSIMGSARLIFYSWILSSQILCNLHLLQSFFRIMLTEEINFVIDRNHNLMESDSEIGLAEALSQSDVVLIQKLAALSLYNISQEKMSHKRAEIFTLSMPGGHPYNWIQISSQCLCLINAFIDELASSVQNISTMKTMPLFTTAKPNASEAAEKILLRQYNESFCIRRLIAEQNSNNSLQGNLHQKSTNPCQNTTTHIVNSFVQQLEKAYRIAFRTIPGLFYVFGEADGAKTIFLLSDTQSIVWLCQGLAGICAASLLEDRYGVVQSTLPQIIKTLLHLKMELDKLNNVNLNGTKLDRYFIALKNAVKRSLYRICTVFGDYMRELIEDNDDRCQLQSFLMYQEI